LPANIAVRQGRLAVVVEDGPDNTVIDPPLAPDLDRDGDNVILKNRQQARPATTGTEGTERDLMIEEDPPGRDWRHPGGQVCAQNLRRLDLPFRRSQAPEADVEQDDPSR
jgi:hypothetical protein